MNRVVKGQFQGIDRSKAEETGFGDGPIIGDRYIIEGVGEA